MNAKHAAAAVVLIGAALYASRAAASTDPSPNDGNTSSTPAPLRTLEDVLNTIGGSLSDTSSSDPDANLGAFLMMIRTAEGTAAPDGYQALFGYRPGNGKIFTSFADHPRQRFSFTQTDGKTNYTTAAGAYQETVPTYDRVASKLGISDFTPASQDAIAIELIREKGALEDVRAGRFDVAVNKLGGVWASLPSANVPQPRRSWDYVRTAYASAGGALA